MPARLSHAVIVTGASSGIGAATARLLAARGHHVVNLDIAEPGETGAQEFHKVDLADTDRLGAVLAEVTAAHQVLGLVNNAGYARRAPLEETSVELMDMTYAVNVRAAMLCAQAVLPAMKAAGYGRIVNIASRAALGKELRTAYAGSKGTLISMAKVWALELGQHGITVNAIGPGPIATELYLRMNPPETEAAQRILRSIPVGRIGKPEDIANAIGFFMDPASGFVTGQVLYVCGGLTVGAVGN